MGPKWYHVSRVYFGEFTSECPTLEEITGAVDITEYIMGGDFNMNPNQSERRPNEVPRKEVLHFIRSVLGVNPGLVRSVTIDGDEIDLELVTLRIVD